MDEQELRALVRLLDDSNPTIAEQAGETLVEEGAAALPLLRELADMRPTLAARLTGQIRARQLETAWATLAQQPDAEQASQLLAGWLDPLHEPGALAAQLDELAAPLRGSLPSEAGPQGYKRDALALRDWLAGAKHFRGNVNDYYAPDNSLLPHVLATRRGLPLTLSLLYLFVARRLAAPLVAIGMPRHLLVRYGDAEAGLFIDPFHQGALLNARDCQRWMARQGIPWQPHALAPISEHALVERMLRNLINGYAHRGDVAATQQVVRYLDIWTDHHAGG